MHCCPSSAAAATLPAAQRLQTFHSAHHSWVRDSEHSSQQQTLISDTRHWAGSAAASEQFPTLNLQKGFSCVNSTGAMLLLKYPFPDPQKACSWFHFAKIASLSSPKRVGAERALAVLMSWFDWAGVWAGWLNKPLPSAVLDEENQISSSTSRASLPC